MANLNVLQWDGTPGHYEVYYLSATDPASGIGLWIRYTMVAPITGAPTCALWFMAMDPAGDVRVGRKVSFPVDQLVADPEPFRLAIGDSELSDRGMAGGFEDVRWELRWEPGRAYEHVHPLLRRGKIAKTVLTLPHADLSIDGTVAFGDRELTLSGARGGQAHLWGSKHANRWAWVHCNDFAGHDGRISSTACRCSCRASGARSGRARPSSGASRTTTSSRTVPWPSFARRARSG